MIWFVFGNYYSVKNKLPKELSRLAILLKKIPVWKTVSNKTLKENKDDELQPVERKCLKCDECTYCLIKKDLEAIKKKKKDENDSNIKILNEFFYFITLFLFLSTNLSIWFIIATN